jgi:hypothetical protein
MIHNVHFILRRFPNHGTKIVVALAALSLSALALGVGLLLAG